MKLGIMQPYFFPYIGYWQMINAVDKYVIYDDVNFIRGGWINRNRILVENQPKMITLQMKDASSRKYINENELLGDEKYNRKLLKQIERCYKRAPYYNEVFELISNIITNDEKNLAKYLEYSIRKICEYLTIDTELIISSSILKDNSLRGQDKIIEICNILEAEEYYNAIGGQELYSYRDFSDNGLKLKFLKTGEIKYKQFNDKFVENLSIIDVMMFNSKEEIKNILNRYELI